MDARRAKLRRRYVRGKRHWSYSSPPDFAEQLALSGNIAFLARYYSVSRYTILAWKGKIKAVGVLPEGPSEGAKHYRLRRGCEVLHGLDNSETFMMDGRRRFTPPKRRRCQSCEEIFGSSFMDEVRCPGCRFSGLDALGRGIHG